jgi:hypothetical protein
MISAAELNPHNYTPTDEQAANLAVLLDRMNQLRAAYGKPMTVTSGLRSQADQAAINPSAPKSMHLRGAACDILDGTGDLKKWVAANVPLLETIGLWCEDFKSTPTWAHFQVLSPKSGHRFFIP